MCPARGCSLEKREAGREGEEREAGQTEKQTETDGRWCVSERRTVKDREGYRRR